MESATIKAEAIRLIESHVDLSAALGEVSCPHGFNRSTLFFINLGHHSNIKCGRTLLLNYMHNMIYYGHSNGS